MCPHGWLSFTLAFREKKKDWEIYKMPELVTCTLAETGKLKRPESFILFV
jgi:hypothetical protein